MTAPKTALASLLLFSSALQAREWKSSDGRALQADFISVAGGQVTLKRSDNGQTVTFPISRLSPEDQAFVKEQSIRPAQPAKPATGPFASLITGDWELSKFKDLPFAFFAAKDLDAAQTYPLVLALHGRSQNDENGKQVGGWMKMLANDSNYKARPCVIVAPLGYQPYGGTGSAWSDKPGGEAISLVKELLKSLPVDKNRIYCAGYSMGGFGTCHLINAEPRLFAAGVAVAGCTGPETAGTFKKVPLWLFHAADDATVEVKYSRDLADALKRDKDCKYTEYETGGHGIIGKVFEDPQMHQWLFSQARR